MTRKNQAITLSISDEDKAKLQAKALEFDCLCGQDPNISKLMKRIANNELLVSEPDNKPAAKKQALIKNAIKNIQNALSLLGELL